MYTDMCDNSKEETMYLGLFGRRGGSDKLLMYEIINNKIIKHYRNKKEIMKPGIVAYECNGQHSGG